MVVVRSVSTATSTPAGSAACSCGSSALIAVDHLDHVGARLALDVEDDRRRRRSPRPPSRTFSAPSTTSATSDSRTGAPLR